MSRFMLERYREMQVYTPGEQPQMQNLIKLNTNESPFPPSPRVIEAITPKETEKLRLYSDPTAAQLVNAIAKVHGLDSRQVFVGNGSDEVLAFAFLAFGQRGVAFPDITYGFYPVWADLFGLNARVIPLKEDFTVDLPAMRDSECGMLVLANPNAPTGIALSPAEIETLLKADPDRLVLVDEAYIAFGAQSALPLLNAYDNLLIVRTFSKSHSLAGARIGYALSGTAVTEDLNRIKFSFHPYNLNRLSILAGEAAILDTEYYDRCAEAIVANRESLTEQLRGMGFTVLDSSANFIFASPPVMNCKAFVDALRERSIVVRWFGLDRIRDYTRITIGTREQTDALVRAAREILGKEGIL